MNLTLRSPGCSTFIAANIRTAINIAFVQQVVITRGGMHRTVAQCHADGQDMVRAGWAFDWPKYSDGYYADDQTYAQVNQLGLWRQGVSFVYPWDYRKGHVYNCKADMQANATRQLTAEELDRLCPSIFPP